MPARTLAAEPAMPLEPDDPAPAGAPVLPSPRAGARPGARALQPLPGSDALRKPVNALAIVPQSRRITPLFRKSYNVMLHLAQQQGLERDVYRAPVAAVLAGVDFDSNDTALVKRHLRAMATTAVEWQSPTTGEGAAWAISGLIGHAEIKRERGQNWLEWSYSVKLKQELLEPSVFARLSIEIIAQLRSHAGIALYEICSRYRDIGRSARQPWTWWRPVLSGKPETDKQRQLEYRFFKRDVLKKAVAEVNAVTDLEVELVEYKDGRFISELQFLIRRKAAAGGGAAAGAAGAMGAPAAPGSSGPPGASRLRGSGGLAGEGVPAAALAGRTGLHAGPAVPPPLDLSLVVRAVRLGIDDERAEQLLAEHGDATLRQALDTLEKRLSSAYPEPLRDAWRYLRSVLPPSTWPPAGSALGTAVARPAGSAAGELAAGAHRDGAGADGRSRDGAARPASPSPSASPARPVRSARSGPSTPAVAPTPATHPGPATASAPASVPPDPAPATLSADGWPGTAPPPVGATAPAPRASPPHALAAAAPASSVKRRNRWAEEWLRQRRERIAEDIAAQSPQAQQALCDALLADMQQRNVHPSIRKRLQTSGWQHAMVLQEMLRFYAVATIGEHWDQPSAADLLQVAERLGDGFA